MKRKPLPPGYEIILPNGAGYTIDHLIGEGGFSLIYLAKTEGGTSSAVIKEFFPAKGAYRDDDGVVKPVPGCEEGFFRNLDRFREEGRIGGRISDISFQTISFSVIGDRFALLKMESSDMRSIAEMVSEWENTPPIPPTGKFEDCDPVFSDMVRIRYAFRITESVLAALKTIHEKGFLHLLQLPRLAVGQVVRSAREKTVKRSLLISEALSK